MPSFDEPPAPPWRNNPTLKFTGFLHTQENPAWTFERNDSGDVTLTLRGVGAPLIFDQEHFEMFLKDAQAGLP